MEGGYYVNSKVYIIPLYTTGIWEKHNKSYFLSFLFTHYAMLQENMEWDWQPHLAMR